MPKMGAKATTRHVRTLNKISAEYVKENKQNKLTAKHLKVNIIQEQAGAMEELIATSTETHFRQIETLIKNTMDAMKEMMLLIKNNKHPTNSISQTNEAKKKKRDKKCKKKDAPICKHCGNKHTSKDKDECLELDKNKDS
jgi:hypothetical protein